MLTAPEAVKYGIPPVGLKKKASIWRSNCGPQLQLTAWYFPFFQKLKLIVTIHTLLLLSLTLM